MPPARDDVPATGPRAALGLIASRNFGPYFAGNALSAMGMWFHNLAAALLIFRLTGSELLLGVLAMTQFAPTLVLVSVAGSVADRFDRRRVVFVSQLVAVALGAALAVLAWVDAAPVVVVLALSLGMGVATAFSAPASGALIAALVEPRDLPSAVGLNSMTYNLARALGPALAALVVQTLGIPEAFAINALSYLALAVGVTVVTPRARAPRVAGASTRLRDTFALIRREPQLGGYLLIVMIVGFASDPINTLAPAFAVAFDRPDTHAGLIIGVFGLGAVTAAILLTGRVSGSRRRLGTTLCCSRSASRCSASHRRSDSRSCSSSSAASATSPSNTAGDVGAPARGRRGPARADHGAVGPRVPRAATGREPRRRHARVALRRPGRGCGARAARARRGRRPAHPAHPRIPADGMSIPRTGEGLAPCVLGYAGASSPRSRSAISRGAAACASRGAELPADAAALPAAADRRVRAARQAAPGLRGRRSQRPASRASSRCCARPAGTRRRTTPGRSAFDLVLPAGEHRRRACRTRFRDTSDGDRPRRSSRLGVDARVGEVPGEYCRGRVHRQRRRARRSSSAPRSARSAAAPLLAGFVTVEGADRLRDVLVPVYRRARASTWDPATVGDLAGAGPRRGRGRPRRRPRTRRAAAGRRRRRHRSLRLPRGRRAGARARAVRLHRRDRHGDRPAQPAGADARGGRVDCPGRARRARARLPRPPGRPRGGAGPERALPGVEWGELDTTSLTYLFLAPELNLANATRRAPLRGPRRSAPGTTRGITGAGPAGSRSSDDRGRAAVGHGRHAAADPAHRRAVLPLAAARRW